MDVTLVVTILFIANAIIWVCILAMFLRVNSAKKYVEVNEQKAELNLELIFNAQSSLAEGMHLILSGQTELKERLETIILILKEFPKYAANNGHKPAEAAAAVIPQTNFYQDYILNDLTQPETVIPVVVETEPVKAEVLEEPTPEDEPEINIIENPTKKERSPEERKAFGEKMKAAREEAKRRKDAEKNTT
jgi:hypothetical protein